MNFMVSESRVTVPHFAADSNP